MIEWTPLNPISAPHEIEETAYLILMGVMSGDRIISATHDATNRWFYYKSEGQQVVIPYRYITHYAEFNFPSVSKYQTF